MQLQEAIEKRKSVRKYANKKPDWREIIECIDATRFAPMAGNIFSLKFILVDDEKNILEISEACQQPFVSEAKILVVVCSDKTKTEIFFGERSEIYLRQQAGAGIQNFLLSLTEKKLDTCWVGHFFEDKIKSILRIPENVQVEAIFPIGIPSRVKGMQRTEKDKTLLENVLRFNDYKTKKMQGFENTLLGH